MRWLVVLVAVVLGAREAQAGAVLSGGGAQRFPISLDVRVQVRAQVETTEMVLRFDAVPAGDHVLTVPSPERGYVVGVDLDQGAGFVPAPMVGEAPPPAIGG